MSHLELRYCFRKKDLDELQKMLEKQGLETMDKRDDKGSIYEGSVVAKKDNLYVAFWPLGGMLEKPHWYDYSKLSDGERELKELFHDMYKSHLSRKHVAYAVTSGVTGAATSYLLWYLLNMLF